MFAQQRTILMMAGGTGGHIFPALAIADEIKKHNFKIVWLGTKKGLESRLVPENGYAIEYIDIVGLRGKGVFSILSMPYKLFKAIAQTFAIIKRVKPVLAIGMGGFVTGPGGLVSWLMGKPLVIHEQNAISGMSNNILSFFAKQKLCAFPNAYQGKYHRGICIVTGNPIRKELLEIDNNKTSPSKQKDLMQSTLNILVLGGSLGAQKINEVLPPTIDSLRQRENYDDSNESSVSKDKKNNKPSSYQHYSIRHQCGKGKVNQVKKLITELNLNSDSSNKQQYIHQVCYQVTEFIDDMAQAYQWADLVICRAGALTVSEIACVGRASILIPYPYAVDDHQTQNAKYLTQQQAGFLLAQSSLTVASLKQIIKQCTPETIADMAQKAKKLAKPNATKEVAYHCLSWLSKEDIRMEMAND